jgi:preprotein translocase subunit SecE
LRPGEPGKIVNELTKILIWAAVIGAFFAYLWWQGQVRRFATYVQETREELKKCSWPTWQELKGSTLVIAISIALLGVFVMAADECLYVVFFKIFKL